MILDIEYQYLGNWNNNATHISSVEMNVGMVYMHILFPWPCQLLLYIYNAHAASQSFYMSQIGYYPFH